MTPTSERRTIWIRRRALALAERDQLNADSLARAGMFSKSQARRWIARLLEEGVIVDLGLDPEHKTGGRRRHRYGLA